MSKSASRFQRLLAVALVLFGPANAGLNPCTFDTTDTTMNMDLQKFHVDDKGPNGLRSVCEDLSTTPPTNAGASCPRTSPVPVPTIDGTGKFFGGYNTVPTEDSSDDCPTSLTTTYLRYPPEAFKLPYAADKMKFWIEGCKDDYSGCSAENWKFKAKYDGDGNDDYLYIAGPIFFILLIQDPSTGTIYGAKPVFIKPSPLSLPDGEDSIALDAFYEAACNDILAGGTYSLPAQTTHQYFADDPNFTEKEFDIAAELSSSKAYSGATDPGEVLSFCDGWSTSIDGTYSVEVTEDTAGSTGWAALPAPSTGTVNCIEFDSSTLKIKARDDESCVATTYLYRVVFIDNINRDTHTSDPGYFYYIKCSSLLTWGTPAIYNKATELDTNPYSLTTLCDGTTNDCIFEASYSFSVPADHPECTFSAEMSTSGDTQSLVTSNTDSKQFTFDFNDKLPLAAEVTTVQLSVKLTLEVQAVEGQASQQIEVMTKTIDVKLSPCLTGTMLSLDADSLVLDETLSDLRNGDFPAFDASIRSGQIIQILTDAINADTDQCGDYNINIMHDSASYMTIGTVSKANDLISMDYTGWQLASSPYETIRSFTVEVFYSLYPDSSLVKSHSFTLTELDCSVRFSGVTQDSPFFLYMNHETSKVITFNAHANTPDSCKDQSRIDFRLNGALASTYDFVTSPIGGNWNDFQIDITSVNIENVAGHYAGTIDRKEGTESVEDLTFDLYMCLITAPSFVYRGSTDDNNFVNYVDKSASNLSSPIFIPLNVYSSSVPGCGNLVYTATATHTDGSFDLFANGGSFNEKTLDDQYDASSNELKLTNLANYPVGVITVTVTVHLKGDPAADDPSVPKLYFQVPIYVVDCLSEGNAMTVTSSFKDGTTENSFGTSFQMNLQLDSDDSYTFDNAETVYINQGTVYEKNLCPIDKYRITCTDPQGQTLQIEEVGTLTYSGTSTTCTSLPFTYRASLTTRTVSANEENFPSVLNGTPTGQSDFEGTFNFKIEAIHASNTAYASGWMQFSVIFNIGAANIETAECLPAVKFASSRTIFDYVLGSGPQSLTLPSLTQKPECGLVFNEFAIDDSLAQDDLGPLATAVQLKVDGQKMLVDATDIALLDKQIDIFVDLTTSDKEKVSRSTSAIVTIKFISDPSKAENLLALDLKQLAVPRITCSPEDVNWVLKLPPFLNLDKSNDDVVFTLLLGSSQDLLVFDKDKRTLYLSPLISSAIMRGETCPSSNISLQFNLSSERLGAKSILPIVIPVVPNKDIQYIPEDLPELKVTTKSQISSTGQLKIYFNSNVLWPALKTEAEGRMLTDDTKDAGLEISELIKAKVLETGEEDDDAKKKIVSLALQSFSAQQLVIKVDFEYPEAITPDIREPDELLIEFYKPEHVLQEGTLKQLQDKEALVTLNIAPQFTQEKQSSLFGQASTSEKVMWLIMLLEFLVLFISGKAIFQMWSLLLCLQFVVYMALWLIPLDPAIRLIVDDLRYIVLNQLFDKYDFAAIAQESLGLGSFQLSSDNITEKIGFERLSDQSGILANLGPTFMMTLLVICLILLLVAIFYLITKSLRQENSKLGIFIDKVQKKVFFQMFIRYLILNALKLDMTLMTDLTNSEGSKLVTAILLGIFTVIPAGFALLLWRIRNDLDDENKKTRYGNLYTDFNHQSAKDQKVLYAYHAIFFVRRSLFIVLTIFLLDSPNLQLALQLILTLGTLSFILHFRVFLDDTRIKTEAVNEILLLLITALLQLSLAFQEDDQKQYIGWCLIGTIATLIIFNVAMMIHVIIQQRKKKKFEELKQFYEFQKKLYELHLAKLWIEERRDLRYNRRRDRHLIWQLQQREALQQQQQREQEQERAKMDISSVIVEEVRQDRREQPQTQEIVVETDGSGAESSEDCDYHSSDEDEEAPTQLLNGEGHNMRTVQNIPTNKKAPVSVRQPQKSKRAKLRGKGKKGSLTSRASSTRQNVPKKQHKNAKTFSRTSRRPGQQDTRTGSNVRERERNVNDRTQVPEEESEDDLEDFGYENCVTEIQMHSYLRPMPAPKTIDKPEDTVPEPEKRQNTIIIEDYNDPRLIPGCCPLGRMFPEPEHFKQMEDDSKRKKFVVGCTNPAWIRPQSRDKLYGLNMGLAQVPPQKEPQREHSHETPPNKLLHQVPFNEERKEPARAMAMPLPTLPAQLPQPKPPKPLVQMVQRNPTLFHTNMTREEFEKWRDEGRVNREKMWLHAQELAKRFKNNDAILKMYRADAAITAKTRPIGRNGSRR